jgi:uncharacterized Tic20 family protein
MDVPPPEVPPVAPRHDPARSRALDAACHLATLVTFASVFGGGLALGNLPGVVAALLFWLILRQEGSSSLPHARAALDFQLTVLIWTVVGTVLTMTCIASCIGIPLLVLVPIANLVLTLIAGVKAAGGERFEYPWTITFLRGGV